MSRRERPLPKLSKDERLMAATVFLVLLVGPLVLVLWPMVLRDDEHWRFAVMVVCALFLTALLVGQVINAYRRHRQGLTLSAFAYGVGGFALVHVFYGLWVLVTGLSPSKFSQLPIPRSYSTNYFFFATLVGGLAVLALLVELYRRKRAS